MHSKSALTDGSLSHSYTLAHIWACPPSEGDDYIFHCHPPEQKIPKPKRLQDWYKKMLDKAIVERVVMDYKVSLLWNGFESISLLTGLFVFAGYPEGCHGEPHAERHGNGLL